MALHKGFSLLEIIVALLLSAIILTTVMQITFRITKQDASAKKHISKDVKLMMMHMQLLQDISGLCALVYEEAEKGDEKDGAGPTEKKSDEKPIEKSEKKDDKQPEDIRKYFYSVNKDNHLDFFTFVTTHSLTFYGQKAEPLVRVSYKMLEGKEGAGFSLVRKESISLKFEKDEKPGKSAVLLDGIKRFEVTYFYVKPKKEEKQPSEKIDKKIEKPAKKSEKAELPDLGSEKEWGIKKDEDKNKDKESDEQKIPRYIFLQCECENGLKQDFWYEIPFVFEGISQLPQSTSGKKAPEVGPVISQAEGVENA